MALEDKINDKPSFKEYFKKIKKQVSIDRILEKGKKATVKSLQKTKWDSKNPLPKNLSYSALNFVGHYQLAGMLPGKIQEELTEEAGIPKTALTWNSVAFSAGYATTKLTTATGLTLVGLSPLGIALAAYGCYTVAETGIRAAYTSITGKPMGTLWMEGIYLIAPHKIKFKEPQELEEQKNNLFYIQEDYSI